MGVCCIPVFTAPGLPPPWPGQLCGPAPCLVMGPLRVPGVAAAPLSPLSPGTIAREQVSSPYTMLALSTVATLPKTTFPSSPLAAAAAYGSITPIADPNYH